MIYVLKGWIRFTYEGQGEFTFRAGDSCLQPAGIIHDELACSDDVELIEFTSPAEFETHRVDQGQVRTGGSEGQRSRAHNSRVSTPTRASIAAMASRIISSR